MNNRDLKNLKKTGQSMDYSVDVGRNTEDRKPGWEGGMLTLKHTSEAFH